jgi:hypothetical protein
VIYVSVCVPLKKDLEFKLGWTVLNNFISYATYVHITHTRPVDCKVQDTYSEQKSPDQLSLNECCLGRRLTLSTKSLDMRN